MRHVPPVPADHPDCGRLQPGVQEAAATSRLGGPWPSLDGVPAPALEEIARRLTDGERLLCLSAASFGARGGALAVLARGHRADERGAVAISDRRLLFVGEAGGRLLVESAEVKSATIERGPRGRRDLLLLTAAGPARLHGISELVGLELLGRWSAGAAVRAGAASGAPSPRRGRAARLGATARAHWHGAVIAAGALIWVLSLRAVQPSAVGDAGLITALSPLALVALAATCAGLGVVLVDPATSERDRLAALLTLVLVLYGAPSVIGDVTSFNVTWRHAGISSYIAEHGSVDPSINAYFNWPGFFILQALAVDLAGLRSAIELARWTPLALNLMYLAPLLLIGRSVAVDDARFPWMVAGVFYLGNWAYQDYASPQGLMFVLYLSLVAIVLTWLGSRAEQRAPRRTQAALLVVCFALVLATVGTHQLTPFAMLASVAALVLVRRTPFRCLPGIVATLTFVWVVFAAGAYLSGHIDELKDQVGQIGATVSSSVGTRVSGSFEHVLVTRLRLASAGGLWILALLAVLRLLRRRDARFWPYVVLAAVPFSLIALQAYGGEIVLRVYIFSLPFMAVLVASLAPVRTDRLRAAAVGALVALAALTFVVTRYGNLRIELFAAGEVQVIERAYEIAPEGALLLAPNPQLPWEFDRVGDLRQRTIDGALRDSPPPANLADAVVELAEDAPTYVLITRNTREYEQLFGTSAWGSIAALERSLLASARFDRVYRNGDGSLFRLRPEPAGADG